MWLTEDPWPPVFICGVAALAALVWWGQTKRVVALLAVAGCIGLGIAAYVIEAAIITPGEEVEQLTTDLCWQFQRKDPEILKQFSLTAPQLMAMCQAALLLVEVHDDLRLTDMHTTVTNNDTRAVCHFRANATISVAGAGNVGRQPARFELTWAREGDQWKIIGLKRLNPIRDEELGVLDRTAS